MASIDMHSSLKVCFGYLWPINVTLISHYWPYAPALGRQKIWRARRFIMQNYINKQERHKPTEIIHWQGWTSTLTNIADFTRCGVGMQPKLLYLFELTWTAHYPSLNYREFMAPAAFSTAYNSKEKVMRNRCVITSFYSICDAGVQNSTWEQISQSCFWLQL